MTIRYVPPLDSSALDSPSRQIMQELIQGLESVRIFNADLKKVHEYERTAYENELDRKDRETEAIHNAALDEAAAHHNHIREAAEATLRAHLRAEEEAQRQREEAARKEQERIEKEKAEKLRREQEEAARVEAERQAKEKAKAEEARKAQEAENARKAAIEEKQRKERETAEAQKRKAEQDAQKAKEEAEQQARIEQQQKLGAGRLSEKELGVQQRYVELHKVLKEFRTWLVSESKKNPEMKKYIGDLRRTIRKSVGQLRAGKGANTNQVS
jgi:nucleoporin GLE1